MKLLIRGFSIISVNPDSARLHMSPPLMGLYIFDVGNECIMQSVSIEISHCYRHAVGTSEFQPAVCKLTITVI